jgi:polysaccharide export outer membrane protein
MRKMRSSRHMEFPRPLQKSFFVLGVLLALIAMSVGLRAQNPATAPADSSAPPAETPSRPPEASAPVATDTTSSTYKLQPYDLIDVDVYSEEDLHKPARLGSDGTVLLPLIGSVQVGGLTVAEATALITKKYAAGFVKNPSVLITVLQYRKATFSIIGQVVKPGVFEIPEGAHIGIIEALSMAGGFSATAAQNSVTVKRAVDGKDTIFKVKAGDMAQNPDAQSFEVLAGDTVVVPSSLYKKRDFSLLGQVQKPGLYEIPDGAHVTIIDAISLAGGFTPSAAQNSVSVKRVVDGKLTILKVKVSEIAQDPNLVPPEILPGDSIQVPFRNSTFSILGQVQRPGMYEIPEGSHTNIIEAVLMAGGYTRTAAQNSVTVKRLVGGKLVTLKVRAGDMAQDANVVPFEVLPGDIIKVNESWF